MVRTKQVALAGTLGAAMLASIIAGCGSTGGSGGTGSTSNGKGCTQIGVLLPETNTSPRWEGYDKPDLLKDIPQELSGAKVDYYNAGGSASTQLTQAQSALTKGDCILVVAPSDLNSSAQIVAKAKAQGVPVIAYDRLINSSDLAYYVSYDNVQVGKDQGQYVADHYKDYANNGQTPNAIMINGSQTDNNAILFNQGALDVLQPLFTAGTINLKYQTFTPNWDPPTAEKEAAGALSAAGNNIQIAYSANDDMAGAIITALNDQHMDMPGSSQNKVLVTGQDATVAGLARVLVGTQAMTIFKEYAKEADATAKLVAAISNGTDTSSLVSGKSTKTPSGANIPSVLLAPETITASNVNDVVQSGQVTKQDICNAVPSGGNTNGFC